MDNNKEYLAIEFIGGPANRFFEYHTATYLAKIWNKEFIFDPSKTSPKGMHHDENFKITDFFKCKTFSPSTYHVIIRQFDEKGRMNPDWKDDLLRMNAPAGNVLLTDGWYQTFWEGHITIPKLPKSTIHFDVSKAIFIAVRRGDFVGSWLEINLNDYYKRAYEKMEKLFSGSTYLVCSDDITWCKDNMKHIKEPFFLENTGYKETLWLLSRCKRGAILANSSYGLWGAFLARINNNLDPSFKVFMPSRWTTDENMKNFVTPKYLYPLWGEKIDI